MDYQNLLAMRDFIKGQWDKTPLLGIILGSGLSYLQDYVTIETILESFNTDIFLARRDGTVISAALRPPEKRMGTPPT